MFHSGGCGGVVISMFDLQEADPASKPGEFPEQGATDCPETFLTGNQLTTRFDLAS